MKTILMIAAALVSLSQASQAAELSSLTCVATNGVTMKGDKPMELGLPVETHWGIFKRDFIATLGEATTKDDGTVINLSSKTGVEYSLSLATVPANGVRTFKASGKILHPSGVRGVAPSLVAFVRCEIAIR